MPENDRMPSDILSNVFADMQAVADAVDSGDPLDAELIRRVQARAAKAREELVRTEGAQDIGVDLIRAARDEVRG
jgi:hypothetical protein